FIVFLAAVVGTMCPQAPLSCLSFFHDAPATELYTLSLHDALPILTGIVLSLYESSTKLAQEVLNDLQEYLDKSRGSPVPWSKARDRKSTRLNSSHGSSSYAVFCLKKNRQE